MRPPLPDFRKAKLGAGMSETRRRRRVARAGRTRARASDGASSIRRSDHQIEHELKLIGELGFAGFFLVMADAVRFARHKGILCQGRGSAANSAVAFCLGITAVDPVKHGLLFERFLSEARVDGKAEPPDIDVDFEHERREEVLDYMYENYDREHAAITAVTQCFHAPTAVQDAMRALGYPAAQALEISKRVHGARAAECIEAVEGAGGARGMDRSAEQARRRRCSMALEGFDGLARLRSTHVGGFVLSAQPLGNYLPVEQTTMGRTIVQFDKDDLDMIGVPKFDFLGLGALTMVRMAFDVHRAADGRRGRRCIRCRSRDDEDVRADSARRDDRHVSDREPRADQFDLAHQAGSFVRSRRAGGADSAGPDPGGVRASVHGSAGSGRSR